MSDEEYIQVREHFVDINTRAYECTEDRLNAVQKWYAELSLVEQSLLERAIIQEFLPRQEIKSECILLAGKLRLSSAESSLVDIVRQDSLNGPLAILSLGELESVQQYTFIESYIARFPHHVIQSLAMIDFERALPHIHECILRTPKDSQAYETVTCILYNLLDRKGPDKFFNYLSSLRVESPEVKKKLLSAAYKAVQLQDPRKILMRALIERNLF